MGKHLAFPAVWDTAKETHFSLIASRVLTCELHYWEEETDQGSGIKDSWRVLKGHDSY